MSQYGCILDMIASMYYETESLRIGYWRDQGGAFLLCAPSRAPGRPGGPRMIEYTHMIAFSGACSKSTAMQLFCQIRYTLFCDGPATTRPLKPPFLDELGGHDHDTNIFRAELLTRKTFFWRSIGVPILERSLTELLGACEATCYLL